VVNTYQYCIKKIVIIS